MADQWYQEGRDEFRTIPFPGPQWAQAARPDPDLVGFIASPLCPPGGRAIHFGCGEGASTIFLAEEGFGVVGVDIAPSAIGKARDEASLAGVEIDFRVGNIMDLPELADNSFDFAVNINTLQLLADDSLRQLHLREARRLLRPSGVYFLANLGLLPGEEKVKEEEREAFTASETWFDGREREVDGRVLRPNPVTIEQHREELEEAGFEIIDLVPKDWSQGRRLVAVVRNPVR